MNTISEQEQRRGFAYALGCFLIWGLFPIYWYPINQSAMPAEQILAQRVAWSAACTLVLIFAYRQQGVVWAAFRQPKLLGVYALSSLLIAVNWLVYLWAIVHHRVVDASLGYFINPLFNVFLGWLIFKERMSPLQKWAIALASLGVLWLAMMSGQIPWIALLLAGSFGLYAAIRKLAPMGALAGLTLETWLLCPFALGYLWWCGVSGSLIFSELNALQMSVLVGSGVATTVPLLLFNGAAKRISMSLLGMLQYVGPTLQMLCGLLIFGEKMDVNRLIGYGWVWLGVAVFLYGIWRPSRQ